MRFNNVAGLALGLAIPTGALSVPRNPAPEPAGKIVAQLFCDIVGGLVTVAKQQPQATSFCSSYLKIPVVTKTSTVTSFTATITATATITSGSITTTDATNTITATDTATATASATITETTTTTETINTVAYSSITACASPGAVQKRGAYAPPKKPSCFNNYIEGQALSSACKCLAVPTSSTTTTTTLSLPTTITSSVTVPLTIFATATATDTATVTDTITNTATETSTVTERTTIITGTQQVIAIPTFTVYAIGGDNSGNPIGYAGGNTVGNAQGLSPVLQFTTVDNNKLQVLNGPDAGSIGKTDPNAAAVNAYVFFGNTANGLQETQSIERKNAPLLYDSSANKRGQETISAKASNHPL
ncbi:hypothetical protein J4E85_009948 [Alternaria conjuncta]|uniref:uncharacterized protein n=1 Tax=Alternaria conjuncta TaxID=181017 RepID=UPI002220C044|nr:uncharacterized protein J4E85_009948 [Alternaria conjuncta]KAI4917429.1 hypothetical protein J4E85_009948 [Alternaria conjuncta]